MSVYSKEFNKHKRKASHVGVATRPSPVSLFGSLRD